MDPHTVEVKESDGSVRHLHTKNILVATGSRAVKIPIPGAVGVGLLAGRSVEGGRKAGMVAAG